MTSNPAVRRAGLLLVAVAAAVLTGCSSHTGGAGVATVSSSPGGASGSASATGKADPVAYSQCMRSHGVPKFPDPNPDGGIQIKAGPGTGIDPASATFKAAEAACKPLLPEPPAGQQAQNRAALLKFAQCMRSHGIKDFPDPDADGKLTIGARPGSDLDPNSSLFLSAQNACKSLMPGGGPAGSEKN